MASSSSISLRVSNKKAYVWDVNGETKHLAILFPLITSTRYRYVAFTPPHLWRIDRHSSPSITAKCILGRPAFANARGGRSPRRQGQVRSSTGVPSVTDLARLVGLAVLVDDQNAHHDPDAAELERWDSERLRGIEEQLSLAEEHEAREALNPDRAMSEKAILKRKEREGRKARGETNPLEPSQGISNESLSASFTNEPVPDPESSRTTRLHRSDVTVPRNSTTPYTVHVPGTSSTFEWYDLPTHSFTTLAAARDAGIWDYPETPIQRARCGVFRDLWEQGYFMGGGIKFGGEYLVYPGMFSLAYVSSREKKAREIVPGLISVVLERELRYSRLSGVLFV